MKYSLPLFLTVLLGILALELNITEATNAAFISPVYLLHRFMDRIKVEVLRGSNRSLRENNLKGITSRGRQCLLTCYSTFGVKIDNIVSTNGRTGSSQSVMTESPHSLFKQDIVIGVCRAYQGVRHCMDSCEFPLSSFREFPLSPAYRFLTEPLDFICIEKFPVLAHTLPCFQLANNTVERVCRSRCESRVGLDAVLNFAITEPQRLHKQAAIARVNEMCRYLDCSLACETDIYTRVCESPIPSNLLRQFYHFFYTKTLEFLDPLNIDPESIIESCANIATPIDQIPFTTTLAADQWWRRVTTTAPRNVGRQGRQQGGNNGFPAAQPDLEALPTISYPSRGTTPLDIGAELGYQITERLTPPPKSTTPTNQHGATPRPTGGLGELIDIFDAVEQEGQRNLITGRPDATITKPSVGLDENGNLRELVDIFDVNQDGNRVDETAAVTHIGFTEPLRPTRYTITPMTVGDIVNILNVDGTSSTLERLGMTRQPATQRPQQPFTGRGSHGFQTTPSGHQSTNLFMSTTQESSLGGLINIFDVNGNGNGNGNQNVDSGTTFNPNSQSQYVTPVSNLTTDYQYEDANLCATKTDIEAVLRPISVMVNSLKQQQSDVIRLVQALLRLQQEEGYGRPQRQRQQFSNQQRQQRQVQRQPVRRLAVRLSNREEVVAKPVKITVNDLMNKFTLSEPNSGTNT